MLFHRLGQTARTATDSVYIIIRLFRIRQ
jgi:hypothetical protein